MLGTFIKILYINFKQKFAGSFMTLIELMKLHVKKFNIVDNMHDLMCKGNKDYRSALMNIQDYNMSKIMTR